MPHEPKPAVQRPFESVSYKTIARAQVRGPVKSYELELRENSKGKFVFLQEHRRDRSSFLLIPAEMLAEVTLRMAELAEKAGIQG